MFKLISGLGGRTGVSQVCPDVDKHLSLSELKLELLMVEFAQDRCARMWPTACTWRGTGASLQRAKRVRTSS